MTIRELMDELAGTPEDQWDYLVLFDATLDAEAEPDDARLVAPLVAEWQHVQRRLVLR